MWPFNKHENLHSEYNIYMSSKFMRHVAYNLDLDLLTILYQLRVPCPKGSGLLGRSNHLRPIYLLFKKVCLCLSLCFFLYIFSFSLQARNIRRWGVAAYRRYWVLVARWQTEDYWQVLPISTIQPWTNLNGIVKFIILKLQWFHEDLENVLKTW